MMRCIKCGELIPDNSERCTNCGAINDRNSKQVIVYASLNESVSKRKNTSELVNKITLFMIMGLVVLSFVFLTLNYFSVSISQELKELGLFDMNFNGYFLAGKLADSGFGLSGIMIIFLMILNVVILASAVAGLKRTKLCGISVKKILLYEIILYILVTIVQFFHMNSLFDNMSVANIIKDITDTILSGMDGLMDDVDLSLKPITSIGIGCYLNIGVAVLMAVILCVDNIIGDIDSNNSGIHASQAKIMSIIENAFVNKKSWIAIIVLCILSFVFLKQSYIDVDGNVYGESAEVVAYYENFIYITCYQLIKEIDNPLFSLSGSMVVILGVLNGATIITALIGMIKPKSHRSIKWVLVAEIVLYMCVTVAWCIGMMSVRRFFDEFLSWLEEDFFTVSTGNGFYLTVGVAVLIAIICFTIVRSIDKNNKKDVFFAAKYESMSEIDNTSTFINKKIWVVIICLAVLSLIFLSLNYYNFYPGNLNDQPYYGLEFWRYSNGFGLIKYLQNPMYSLLGNVVIGLIILNIATIITAIVGIVKTEKYGVSLKKIFLFEVVMYLIVTIVPCYHACMVAYNTEFVAYNNEFVESTFTLEFAGIGCYLNIGIAILMAVTYFCSMSNKARK